MGIISQLLIAIVIFNANVFAAPALQDIFSGFVKNSELAKDDKTVEKRRVFETNSDGELKQISLQSLINGFEDSLLQSALSVGSVASDKNAFLPEIRPASHQAAVSHQSKRETDEKAPLGSSPATTTTAAIGAVAPPKQPADVTTSEPGIVLQTTKKVTSDKAPHHVIIDRVLVEPHSSGSLPLIPAFQVHHTKVISIKDSASSGNDKATQISITQTSLKSSDNANGKDGNDSTEHNPQQQKVTIIKTTQTLNPTIVSVPVQGNNAATSTPAATEAGGSSTVVVVVTPKDPNVSVSKEEAEKTTKQPIVKLKEAEEELKEKVAEIEAEPVILSARV